MVRRIAAFWKWDGVLAVTSGGARPESASLVINESVDLEIKNLISLWMIDIASVFWGYTVSFS
ncbi:MAG: hypothetical protein SCK70_16225, partial [bacterium]|nr:hypothetical protein [bacterium]